MTLRRISNFDTDDPVKLTRQLSQLEDNASNEFGSVRAESVPLPAVSSFAATSAGSIVAILPDQQLSVDTTAASASVVFPALSPRNFGRRFILIKRAAANSIATSCQDPTILCNGAAFPAISAVGITIFFCDAAGYYRK